MSILTKDSVENTVSVVCVKDAFQPELNWSENCHEEGVEDASIRIDETEAVGNKEVGLDQRNEDGSVQELVKNYFCTAMRHCSMSEEKVSKAIHAGHLNVCMCQSIGLSELSDHSNCHICFVDGELV